MSYHFTIARFGLLASDRVLRYAPSLSGQELIETFRRQADSMSRHLLSPPLPIRITFPSDDDVHDQSAGDRTLLATLGAREHDVELEGGRAWHIREHVSLTACSLNNRLGRTKIWLTIEGMPDAAQKSPEEEMTPIAFLDLVRRVEDQMLLDLRSAYIRSLGDVLSESLASEFAFDARPIKISMTDDDTRSVANLVDALYFDSADPAELEEQLDKIRSMDDSASSGLYRLRNFFAHAAPDADGVMRNSVAVETTAPTIKGVVCRVESTLRYASQVVGLARRAGQGGGYDVVLKELDQTAPLPFEYLRQNSASRRLSAKLAAMEAHRLAGPREPRP